MKSIIHLTGILFVLSLVIFIEGCRYMEQTYQKEYKPGQAIKKEGFPVDNPVFLCNVDKKECSKIIPTNPDADPLILIPLWPYTHSETSPILRCTYLQSNILNTVKHIIAQDIRAAGIFKYTVTETFNVEDKNEAKYQAQAPANAYIIKISVLKAVWSRYLTSYGLSYPGTILWAFGLPVSYGNVKMSIKVDIYPPDCKKPILEKVITKETSCTEWIYDQINYGPPVSEFALAEIFPQTMTELRNAAIEAVEKYNEKVKVRVH
jgi:hypothetical protein